MLNLLGILASTMLTVATFSVSAMVGAFAAVSTTATPRATRIVMADRSSQNALASFLSAFIYAIVALVALSILDYGVSGRLLLFVGYVTMVAWVLTSFVRWVDRISNLGRMGDTLERVEAACDEAFSSPVLAAALGAQLAQGPTPEGTEIFPDQIGYIQNVDVAELNRIASTLGATLRVNRRPGAFVDLRDALAVVPGGDVVDEEVVTRIRGAFQIGDARRLSEDPRFGLILLAEIADRALSPSVNDPGTAIAVLGIQLRLLAKWNRHAAESSEVQYPDVEVPPLTPDDLLDDSFTPISRDGAAMVEVGIRLQKCFWTLAGMGNPELQKAALRHSRLAYEQAEPALSADEHRKAVKALVDRIAFDAKE